MSITASSSRPAVHSGRHLSCLADFRQWWSERQVMDSSSVSRIALTDLEAWSFEPGTGNLRHASGGFFTVEGLRVDRAGGQWTQPVINQPEIGILGIVVKTVADETFCLMQAKMEPGNVNGIQLSPSVQATRSNYLQLHRGSPTQYLECFVGPDRGKVLVDVLQSEQGAWFWRKRNRNMVVEVLDVPVEDDNYSWISLRLLRSLLAVDNLVNMDSRTVLSCLPMDGFTADPDDVMARPGDRLPAETEAALVRSVGDPGTAAHTSTGDILSWFTEAKTRCDWSARLVPLSVVSGWRTSAAEIADAPREQFRFIGVAVAAGQREVRSWTQPLLEPFGQNRVVFLVRVIDGVLHVLIQARQEYGLMDMMEMAPTLHLLPGRSVGGAEPYVREAITSESAIVLFDQVQSEEGGRFYHALTRYQIVQVDDAPLDVPGDYCWMTVGQLTELLRHGHYLNIEARSLLACLCSLR